MATTRERHPALFLGSWFRSWTATVVDGVYSPVMEFTGNIDPSWLGAMRRCHKRRVKGWFGVNNKQEMLDVSRQKYWEHYALVRQGTPKERLLEYRLGEGWGPLCAFLEKPIPGVPFPRINDSDGFCAQLNITARRAAQRGAIRFAKFRLPCAVALLGGWLYARILNGNVGLVPATLPQYGFLAISVTGSGTVMGVKTATRKAGVPVGGPGFNALMPLGRNT